MNLVELVVWFLWNEVKTIVLILMNIVETVV